jgi:Uma2 family endonuclease
MATVTEHPRPQLQLIETDGEPLESPWHRATIALLIDTICTHLRGRTDFFVGGNMFLYYTANESRQRKFRGPDFFFVDEVDGRQPRLWWAVWDEDGRYPDVIMELLSPSTAETDRTVKKRLYERTFRTPEYFWYDPADLVLKGWRLGPNGHYEAIVPDSRGWLWSEQLQLYIGLWTGKYQDVAGTFPRFFDSQGQLVPTAEEWQQQCAEAEKQRAEAEKQRAEAEKQCAEAEKRRAEAEKQRAETERQRAEAEKQRADQALAEVAALRAQLAAARRGQSPGQPADPAENP